MRKRLHWFASPAIGLLYAHTLGWQAGIAGGVGVLGALLLVRSMMWPLVDLRAEQDTAALCLVGSVFALALASLL